MVHALMLQPQGDIIYSASSKQNKNSHYAYHRRVYKTMCKPGVKLMRRLMLLNFLVGANVLSPKKS